MIQVYADGGLVYDSRLEAYNLMGLKVTNATDKSGTAELIMPPGHPAYNSFVNYRTVVEVYQDNVLLFRGRAIYPSDDFYNCRTITCEGERGFFRDGVHRAYMYQDGPAAIFAEVIELYNAQVEPFKQFVVGTVTVTDPNNYIRLESEAAEPFSAVLDKLVERCGGYIVFTTNSDGARVVNWYDSLTYRSSQVIEFGSNLLDFARSDSGSSPVTVVIPYGAKDETTGERLTIESVNDGLDFIQDLDAVALRGVIAKAVYWDDVTEATNLLAKAQQYLAANKMIITALELSAVDLSLLDQYIDNFQVGDIIRVRSKPHNVDEDFQLTARTYDLLNPENSKISLGKDLASLTGADVAGDRQNGTELQRVERNIRADYTLNIAAAIADTKQTLTSLIQQTSDAIKLEVSELYTSNDEVVSMMETRLTQLSDSFNFQFTSLQATVDENDAEARTQFELIEKYIRFEDGNIILGESGNPLILRIENDRISFLDAGAEVAYFSNKQLYVTDAHFLNSLQIGNFKWLPRENGNLSLVKVGA